MVWVCLDPDTEPLAEYLAPLPDLLACYHLDTFAISQDQSVEWECNWKVAVDAFHETYHNLATHPQLMPVAGDVNARIECYTRHSRFILPSGCPVPTYRKPPTAAADRVIRPLRLRRHRFEGTADEVLVVFQKQVGLAPGTRLSRRRHRVGSDNREPPLHHLSQHPGLLLPGQAAGDASPAPSER